MHRVIIPITAMTDTINLAGKIEQRLPAELVNLLKKAAEIASSHGEGLYVAGGIVRDLLLDQTSLDVDIVVEGNAIELARHLQEFIPGSKIVTHAAFGTAKIQGKKWNIDLTTARSETYAKPGALPTVKPGTIREDLFRRDFTINAMAICLSPDRYGELLDLYGGRDDLRNKLIRILHEKSFIDDATRIWRALRYEQRLDFSIESGTLRLLKSGIPMLAPISADRIRYEVECIFQEKLPEKMFGRAEELGVLPELHPSLRGDEWLAEKFEQARRQSSPEPPGMGLYLVLLAYRLTDEENESLITRLKLSKAIAQILRETNIIKCKLPELSDHGIPASGAYHLLNGYSQTALTAVLIAGDSPLAKKQIDLFLNKLRYVKPVLTGDDLKRMGLTGADIGTLLHELRDLKLEGKIATREDEERVVSDWLARNKN